MRRRVSGSNSMNTSASARMPADRLADREGARSFCFRPAQRIESLAADLLLRQAPEEEEEEEDKGDGKEDEEDEDEHDDNDDDNGDGYSE